MSSLDTFKVYTRCRPLNQRQITIGTSKKAVSVLDKSTLSLSDCESKQSTFEIDGIFTQDYTNHEIFQQSVVPLVDNFMNGINSTIFAYGITGAGKSYTMFGSQNTPGLIPLTFEYLLNITCGDSSIKLGLSYLQIYNQQTFDLFSQKSENLQITEDPTIGIVVNDLTEIELTSIDQARQLIELGNERRVVAETKANQFSSRSHAIVIITIEKTVGQEVYFGKFSLVDLAGSERQSVHQQARGIRSFEGSNINKSLLTLGNCINLLSQKKKSGGFIPYRDSKLTRLLKDSLGGNTKTVMIACISQSALFYDETINTMKYACRANKIEKVIHQNVKENKTLEEYKKENIKLKKQTQLLKMGCFFDEKQLKQKEKRVKILLQQLVSCASKQQNRNQEDNEFENSLKQKILNEFIFDRQQKQPKKEVRAKKKINDAVGYDSVSKKEPASRISLKSKLFRNQEKIEKIEMKSIVNLQNLREKTKREQRKIQDLLEAVKNHTLTLEEIKENAKILLQSAEILTEQERQKLLKLKEGHYYEFDGLEHKQNHKFALKNISLMSGNANPSRNRHLAALQKIMNLNKNNKIHQQSLSYRSQMSQSIKQEQILQSQEELPQYYEEDYEDLYA